MCGLPGSGKTTYIREKYLGEEGKGIVVLSNDKYIGSVGGTYTEAFAKIQAEVDGWKMRVEMPFFKDLTDAIGMKDVRTIIIDNTNLTNNARFSILRILPKDWKTCIYWCIPPSRAEHERRLMSRPDKIIGRETLEMMNRNSVFPLISDVDTFELLYL